MTYLIVALLSAAIAIFALQNSAETSVRFFVWTFDRLPLAGVVLTTLGIALVVVGVPLWIRSWRWRSRARAAEARIAALEKTLSERDQLLARPAPPPEPPAARPPAQP